MMSRTALALAVAIAVAAAIIALDAPASAQSDDTAGRIVARLLDDGRVEFGWQPTGWERVLPRQRYFPTDAEVGRWLNSSPVTVNGAAIGRINARLLDDGKIEFAFTPTDGERILTNARYFPTTARPNRWLRSTEISTAPSAFIAVSAGYEHTCAIRESGAIECWGRNIAAVTDAPEGKFAAVSVGQDHSCAIRDTGEIACWGDNTYRQVHYVPEGSYTAVSAGGRFTCAIAETFAGASSAPDTGEIECWGSHDDNRHAAPEGRFRAISAGRDASCAIRESGESVCWGAAYTGQTTGGALYIQEQNDWVSIADPPAGPFTAVSATYQYTCGLRESGEIACWGDAIARGSTRRAAVHNATSAVSLMNDQAPKGNFTAVSAGRMVVGSTGREYACALSESGEIVCWWIGGTITDAEAAVSSPYPTLPPAGRFIAVSVGRGHACAIHEGGRIECWGGNEYGQATPPAR